MSHFFHALLRFLFHAGYFGPFLMGIMDSSFLFLPFGNDILIVILVAQHHQGYLLYVLSAVCGSTLGIFLLDLIARKGGEEGVQKVAGKKRYDYLQHKIEQHGGKAIALGSLAPPPFPFTMLVATTSALSYPRVRLLAIVAITRAVRFLILGWLALKFGHAILRIINSSEFKWTMIVFAALCAVGSVLSIMKWMKRGKSERVAHASA